jgi:hypothetical protein
MNMTSELSVSGLIFRKAIEDAEKVVAIFEEKSNGKPDVAKDLEYLKRAGLVLAMVAWETYVKNCVQECVETRIATGVPQFAAKIIREQLEVDLKTLNTPDAGRTKKIFLDYTEVDITKDWEKTQTNLNDWLKLRGEAAHKSRHQLIKSTEMEPHLLTKPELKKIINGLCRLVEASEKTLVAGGVLKPCVDPSKETQK